MHLVNGTIYYSIVVATLIYTQSDIILNKHLESVLNLYQPVLQMCSFTTSILTFWLNKNTTLLKVVCFTEKFNKVISFH